MIFTRTANAAELNRDACIVQASRHRILSKRGLHLRAHGGVSKEKEAKPLRSEINEAVKLNVPAFPEPY
jgi:hypothetical protein